MAVSKNFTPIIYETAEGFEKCTKQARVERRKGGKLKTDKCKLRDMGNSIKIRMSDVRAQIEAWKLNIINREEARRLVELNTY